MEENTTGGSKNNVLRSITPNLLNEVGHNKDQSSLTSSTLSKLPNSLIASSIVPVDDENSHLKWKLK